jgi:hypothetical protein
MRMVDPMSVRLRYRLRDNRGRVLAGPYPDLDSALQCPKPPESGATLIAEFDGLGTREAPRTEAVRVYAWRASMGAFVAVP